jgi:hypothetical protein
MPSCGVAADVKFTDQVIATARRMLLQNIIYDSKRGNHTNLGDDIDLVENFATMSLNGIILVRKKNA